MLRVSKVFLIIAGIDCLLNAALGFVMAFIDGLLFGGAGLGFSIAGISMISTINDYSSESYIMNAFTFLFMGGSTLMSSIISTITIVISSVVYEILAIILLISVFSVGNKKGGYIFCIVIGALILIWGSWLLGILVLLGGIFGTIAAGKEKKVEYEGMEVIR